MLLLMLFYTTKIYGHIYNQIYDLLPLHPSTSLTQWIPSQRESILSRRSFPKKKLDRWENDHKDIIVSFEGFFFTLSSDLPLKTLAINIDKIHL